MEAEKTLGHIHSVETFGALDGPGIRYVLFLQGCPLRCAYCHNPDTWDASSGRVTTAEEAVEDVLRYRNFITSGGLTLSGGEPLMQADFCRAVIDLCRTAGIHTALDTSGCISLTTCRHAVDAADLILLDIKALDPTLCAELTGQDNRSALALLNHCELTGKEVWIRHVLVPGRTLIPAALQNLAQLLKHYDCIRRVELLPFHKMGEYKWEALGMRSPCADILEPAKAEIAGALQIFLNAGLPVSP
jgi:pyruvate formate lyase activating enzyme